MAKVLKMPEPPRKVESLPDRMAYWVGLADRVLGNPVEPESEPKSAKEQQRKQRRSASNFRKPVRPRHVPFSEQESETGSAAREDGLALPIIHARPLLHYRFQSPGPHGVQRTRDGRRDASECEAAEF